MKIIAYDKFPLENEGIEYVELEELFSQSDIISLHCPLTEETYHLIDRSSMPALKRGVIIINTSRGALIDAKEGDDVNPERVSAGTHFCFIQGKVLNDEELAAKEARINEIRRNWLYYKFRKQLIAENPALAADSLATELEAQASILVEDTLAEMGPYVIPAEQREVYKTLGGVPHLDSSVTIFGEVVEGLDIVEKMSLVETDKNDRPVKDVVILSTKVFQR